MFINYIIRVGGRGNPKDDRGGGGGVQKGLKKDDVVYEQPLTKPMLVPISGGVRVSWFLYVTFYSY